MLFGVRVVKVGPFEMVKGWVPTAVLVLMLTTPICAVPVLPSRLLRTVAFRVVVLV